MLWLRTLLLIGAITLVEPAASADTSVVTLPIDSQLELETYLQTTRCEISPLSDLTTLERVEFLANISFSSDGRASIPILLLAPAGHESAKSILSLFGQADMAEYIQGPARDMENRDCECFDDDNCYSIDLEAKNSIRQRFFGYFASRNSIIRDQMITEQLRDQQLLQLYRQWFTNVIDTSGSYAKLTDKELKFMSIATSDINLYVADKSIAIHLQQVFDAMVKRGIHNSEIANNLQRTYIQLRLFDKAERLEKRFPDYKLQSIPSRTYVNNRESDDTQYRTLWGIAHNSSHIEQQQFQLAQEGPQLIIVATTHCQFCKLFIEYASGRDGLKQILQQYSIWIAPPDGNIALNSYRLWNQEHPIAQLRWVHEKSQWPEITGWETPYFYFFQDGKLQNKFAGWPRDNSHAEKLKNRLADIGILLNGNE